MSDAASADDSLLPALPCVALVSGRALRDVRDAA